MDDTNFELRREPGEPAECAVDENLYCTAHDEAASYCTGYVDKVMTLPDRKRVSAFDALYGEPFSHHLSHVEACAGSGKTIKEFYLSDLGLEIEWPLPDSEIEAIYSWFEAGGPKPPILERLWQSVKDQAEALDRQRKAEKGG